MQPPLQVEELVINDSFNNYCFQTNDDDIKFWEEYINLYPFEKVKIEEAKEIVLGLHIMLKQEYAYKEETMNDQRGKVIPLYKKAFPRKIVLGVSAAAAVLLAFFILNVFKNNNTDTKNVANKAAANSEISQASVFATPNGQKKTITLPDHSTLHLNSGSTLRIDKGFGKDNRDVYLSGEALFDVTHNASLPFVVHTDNYKVKVLGTLFNIKAYAGDKSSETSLLRGKVVINLKDNRDEIVLKPNQKAVIDNAGNNPSLVESHKQTLVHSISLLPVSHSEIDNTIIETAWVQDKLEIVNESFAEMKDKLQRWYDIKITFKDEEVSKFKFTATFEKENIQETLKALQYAYYFNYSIDGKEITISK